MAKKRKLNKKFLILASIPLVLGVAALAAVKILPKQFPQIKWMVRGTPAKHAGEGKILFEQGKYQEAAEKYMRAIQLNGVGDAPMYTALGDCFAHMVLDNAEAIPRAKAYWDQALIINPSYLPALERELDLFLDDAELSRTSNNEQQWEAVNNAAAKVLQADPNHRKALKAQYRATMERVGAGVATSPQRLQEVYDGLMKLANADPFDADAFYYAMRIRTAQGVERARQADRPGAVQIFEEVAKSIDDALTAHPEDPALRYRAALAYYGLGMYERGVGQRPKYEERVASEYAKAVSLIKPDHPLYVEVKRGAAQHRMLTGDNAGGIDLLRALLTERPSDILVRFDLAQAVARDGRRRGEAIELLENIPPADRKEVVGVKGSLYQRYELMCMFSLIEVRLDVLPTLTDPAESAASLKRVEEIYNKAISRPNVRESVLGLQARGRIDLAKGENIAGKETLERALGMMPASSVNSLPSLEQRFKLMYHLADACMRTEQTGRAKQLLDEMIAINSNFAPARLMKAQVLLREGNKAEARPQLEALAKIAPDAPLVTRLLILTLDPEKDKDQITQLYQKLPETTPAEMTEKAQFAAASNLRDDAVRLYKAAMAANPQDASTTIRLARLYVEMNDKAQAMALMEKAVADNPQNSQLKLAQAEISGANVAEVRRDLIENIQDPFLKELGMYELAIQDGNQPAASQHLQAAARMRPQDGRVLELLFQRALTERQWDQASNYMEQLARLDHDLAGGMLYRVRFAMAKGELDRAHDLAQELTRKMSGIAQSWVVLGQVQRAQRKPAEAVKNFLLALDRQSNNLDAIRGLIAAYYDQNNPSDAARYIQMGRQMFPRYAALREVELQHELRFGDPEKAVAPRRQMLDRAIASKDPNEAAAWLEMAQTLIAVAQSKPTPEAGAPRLREASDLLKQAIAKWPDEMGFVQVYADVSLRLRAFADGEKAIKEFAARPTWQGKPEPSLLLADYYSRADKPAEQEAVLRDFLKTDATNVPVQIQLASLLGKQKKLDEALKVLEGNQDDPMIRRQRIELQIVSGRHAEAERELQTALAAGGSASPILLNRQAYLYMQTARQTEALRILNQVLEQNPYDVEARFFRGSIYVAFRRNLDQAIADLQMVRDGDYNQLQARMLLSDALRLSGDNEGAIRELESAVAVAPLDVSPRLRLVDMYSKTDPPRWSLAERTLREGRNVPQLAKNASLIQAEAVMWLGRKDFDKAKASINEAMQAAPSDQNVLRTYCRILLDAKDYRQLLASTEAMAKGGKAAWWLYDFRGRAHKGMDNSRGAMDEFTAGIEVASAARDDNAVTALVGSIADQIGVNVAKARILDRAEKGENRFRFLMSYLSFKENDTAGALSWLDRVLTDSNSKPDELVMAQWEAANMNMRLDPPNIARAVELYRKLLEKNPNDLSSLNNLACAMILPNSGFTPKQALEYSQKAFNLVQQGGQYEAFLPYIYDTQGYILVLDGRVQEGINLLQVAIEKQPIAEACYHLGEAYLALPSPQPQAAEESLNQALKLLEAAKLDEQPLDAELKAKIEKSLERAKQLASAQ